MRKLVHGALVVGVAGMALIFGGGNAGAGCHIVTLTVDPATVKEGNKVKIRVERDGIAGRTIFDIKTEDVSAKGGEDYPKLNEEIDWPSGGNKAHTFELTIVNDTAMEGNETFKVRLANPEMCTQTFNPSARTITIAANDQIIAQPTPTSAPTPAPTATAGATASPSPSPSPTISPSPSPSVSPSPLATFTPFPSATPVGDDDGLSGLDIAGIVIAAGAVGSAGAYWFFRRRMLG